MDQKKVTKERKRLEALLDQAGVCQHNRDALQPLIDNLAWQRVKLDEARQELQDAGITDSYNNGGGQSGTRENPAFKSYLNLWRGYLAGLEKFTGYLTKEQQAEEVQGITVLENVIRMKEKA